MGLYSLYQVEGWKASADKSDQAQSGELRAVVLSGLDTSHASVGSSTMRMHSIENIEEQQRFIMEEIGGTRTNNDFVVRMKVKSEMGKDRSSKDGN